jgi:predicted kinase
MEQPAPSQPHVDRVNIKIERRALLVVAGLPGAGKSTLLRDTLATAPIALLGTDQIRARLSAMLPERTPYSWYRPLAPVLQRLRLVLMAILTRGPIVLHHAATGVATRAALAVLGAITGRPCHLLWIECTPAEALSGQFDRGRLRMKWSFLRQVRRAPHLKADLHANRPPRGWRTVRVVDRPEARRGLRIVVG